MTTTGTRLELIARLVTLLSVACGDPATSGGGTSGGGGSGGGGAASGQGGAIGGGGDGGHAGGDVEVVLGLNDVSVLFPLPSTESSSDVLRLDASGDRGPLMSPERYLAITEFQAPGPVDYASWIIVSARIDPCFPDLALLEEDPSLCRRQLRLVAQPFAPAPDTQALGALDHALHLLYDLTEEDFEVALEAWVLAKAREADPNEELGVHPVLMEEGLGGPFGTALRDLILTHAGEQTLSQFTFMRGRGVAWDFGGFKVDGEAQVPIQIHGLDPASDRVVFSITSEAEPFAVSPASPEAQALMPLSGEKVDGELVLNASTSAIKEAFQTSLDLENPTRENPDTVDCASCHFGGRARARAEALGEDPGGLERFEDPTFDLSLSVPNEEQANLLQLRAFGWNKTSPVLMQRTINESAAVANALNARLATTSER